MSAPKAMAPLRRRAMPGMSTPTPRVDTPPEPARTDSPPPEASEPSPPRPTPTGGPALLEDGERPARRRSQDYGATRLVNFRLPVDLHDRYRRLVAEVEQEVPRLRRPSLTEVIIGLLEEGPSTVEETAAVIRRKRAGEYDEDGER
jgi:hypothetical protein